MLVKNPLFGADMPDPDVIRVDDAYYMVSTTMFYMPAAPILKSYDLYNWEIVSYVCEQIEDNDIYNLKNGKNAYGKGQWATSLMHHKGRYYACFVCHDMKETYLFSTDDIEKSGWDMVKLGMVCHDMSFLCWQDKVYLVYGVGSIRIVQLKDDLSEILPGTDRLLLETPEDGMRLRCEGCRALVRDGQLYLLFIDWPAGTEDRVGKRREVCYRAPALEGPFERRTLLDDDMWLPGRGVAQGVVVDTKAGDWYAIMFQDSGAVGRMPFLMPVQWADGWPVLGIDGKVPDSFETSLPERKTAPIIESDSLSHTENRLAPVWQWNHNPDPEGWSFTRRPGCLRLTTTQLASDIMDARNTLTQRTIWPGCSYTVRLEPTGMKDGDFAGLCAFQEKYGMIGVRQGEGKRQIVALQRVGGRPPFELMFNSEADYAKDWYILKEETAPLAGDAVWLKVRFSFQKGRETAEFYYSMDGESWRALGGTLEMFYSGRIFVGYRVGLFNYATQQTGGYADFQRFHFEAET